MREFDVVVFGATGFTGRFVAEALAAAAAPVRWAIAGRDPERLAALRRELVDAHGAAAGVPVVVARSDDPASLRAMVCRTKVVASTVGPFEQHGDPLVDACVEHGCDYVDSTGEPAFWRRTVSRLHAAAVERQVLLVPCCGFDSVPHDLGALLTARALEGERGLEIDAFVRATGDPSGGTWASLLEALAGMGRPEPGAGPTSPRGRTRTPMRPHFEPAVGQWVVPLPTVDPLVVRRSAQFCPELGPELRYRHWLQTRTLGKTAALLGGVAALTVLAKIGPTRRWLLARKPQGQGPSAEVRARSKFEVVFIGRAASGRSVRVRVAGRDPGYGFTGATVAAAALVLACDRERLRYRGGVLTPASGLGDPFIERLRGRWLEIDVA
ncbi:MAG: saccharopine dehydrogenase NADP-binding domain-containing protein [Nannocystaceae bacterium]|nr:saccharopine dehydrogenase NADP-binding domain-containing protein [Nannocystaceae bacterium]